MKSLQIKQCDAGCPPGQEQRHPFYGIVSLLISLMLLSAGSIVSAAERLYATDNDSVRLLVDSASKQLQAGQTDVAALTVERALRIEPENPALWYQLARIRYVEQQWNESISLGQRAVSLAADYPELLVRLDNLFTAISQVSQGSRLSLEEMDAMTSEQFGEGGFVEETVITIDSDDAIEPAIAPASSSPLPKTKFGVLVEPIKEPRLHARGDDQFRSSRAPSRETELKQPKDSISQVVERSFSVRDQAQHRSYVIPNEAMPAPGYCRVWYDNRSIESQPPAVVCAELGDRIPTGARLIMGRSRR